MAQQPPVPPPEEPTAPGYGQPPAYQAGYPPPVYGPPKNGIATAGLVCGILSIVTFFFVWIPIILGILGIIFGAVGRGRADQRAGVGASNAKVGLITGVVGIVVTIVWIVLLVTVFSGNVSFRIGSS